MSATLDHINGLVFVPQLQELEAERYHQCNCCPYGYHIDLDFVRYCEALSHGNEISTSKQKRRERRRQRHSMEVLLGLTSPSLWTIEQQLPEVPLEESPLPEKSKLIRQDFFEDALSKAVEVFEDTLHRTHKSQSAQINTNISDGAHDGVFYEHWPGGKKGSQEHADSESTTLRTTPVESFVSGKIRRQPVCNQESPADQVYFSRENEVSDVIVQHDSDAASVGSATSNVSTLQIHPELQNIREQMALSLERMRELEEQVKLIPVLQIQLAILKEEKRILTQKLQENGGEDMRMNYKISNDDRTTTQDRVLSSRQEDIVKQIEDEKRLGDGHSNSECYDQTFSDNTCVHGPNVESKSIKATFRNRGITCSVVTRDVGVSHLHPKTRNSGTNTHESKKKLSFSGMRRENILPDITKDNMDRAGKVKQLTMSMNISNLDTPKEPDIALKIYDLKNITIPKKSVSVLTDLHMTDIEQYVLKPLNVPEKDTGGNFNFTNTASQTSDFLKPVLHICEYSDVSVQVSSEDLYTIQNQLLKRRISVIDVGVQCDCKLMVHAGVQLDIGNWQKTKGVQYESDTWCKDTSIQVDLLVKNTIDVGVTVKPKSVECGIETKVISRDKGTSTSFPNPPCNKCNVPKCNIALVGFDQHEEKEPIISLISLSESSNNRNSNLTNEHSNIISSTVACGPDWKFSTSRSTDSYDLVRMKDVCCNTSYKQVRDVGTCPPTEKQNNEFNGEANSETFVARDVASVESALSLSRIPRLAGPASPTTVRSPTKHATTILSTADKPQKSVSPTPPGSNSKSLSSSVPKVHIKKCPSTFHSSTQEKSQEPEKNQRHHLQRQSTYTKLPEVTEIYSEHVETRQDNRAEPTREMKAALKVINDYFKKNPSKKDLPKHLTNASNIVQQEWFKISGGKSVNPLAVEDYLDYIEGCSTELLEYVVNMTDISGNTALHYAVSSGNFDVVSILLDSKVCNVNKRNSAGYTCVMLATLVKLRCETHRQIIRRMFHLADVNIKAKPHGQTALMLATSHGSLEMVEMLTEAGADMNIQDADGSTALMCAADHGFIDIVKHIIAQPDCDVTLADSDGCTALNIAMESGNRHVGFLLYAHEHFSQGNSPHGSLRSKRSRSSTPTSRSNTLSSSRPGGTPVHND